MCSTEPSGLFRLLKKTKCSSDTTLPALVAACSALRVEVEVGAGGGAHVPAEADHDRGQARRLLGQRDVAALGEADTHVKLPFESRPFARNPRPAV